MSRPRSHREPTPFGKTKIFQTNSDSPEAQDILIVPGYTETPTHNLKLAEKLAKKGFDVTMFSQPRKVGKEPHADLEPIERQAQIVKSILETTSLTDKKVHAVAHSLGAGAVLKAAAEQPESFKSIILMQPVGTVGAQRFGELFGRAAKKFKSQPWAQPKNQDGSYTAMVENEPKSSVVKRVAKANIHAGAFLASQPMLAMREAKAVSQYEIADDVRKVVELGIPVHIVGAHGDELFDSSKSNNTYEELLETASSISEVADANAAHDTFWLQPERTARIIGQLINKS
jgi:alpha-beta hydrolase superfamily lysophospholipase